MKLDVGVYNYKINKSNTYIIPIWDVFIINEWNNIRLQHGELEVNKRAFCLIIYDLNIKEIKILDALKEVFCNRSENNYTANKGNIQLSVISWKSLLLDLNKKVDDFKILDLDFIQELEYEEVREMFGNKEKHPQLWEISSWK